MTKWQQEEVDLAEKEVLKRLFHQETIPEPAAMLLRCLKLDPNKYIRIFEKWIEVFLTGDGYIDGKLMNKTMSVWQPGLQKFFTVPDEEFRVIELVDVFIKLILGDKG